VQLYVIGKSEKKPHLSKRCFVFCFLQYTESLVRARALQEAVASFLLCLGCKMTHLEVLGCWTVWIRAAGSASRGALRPGGSRRGGTGGYWGRRAKPLPRRPVAAGWGGRNCPCLWKPQKEFLLRVLPGKGFCPPGHPCAAELQGSSRESAGQGRGLLQSRKDSRLGMGSGSALSWKVHSASYCIRKYI